MTEVSYNVSFSRRLSNQCCFPGFLHKTQRLGTFCKHNTHSITIAKISSRKLLGHVPAIMFETTAHIWPSDPFTVATPASISSTSLSNAVPSAHITPHLLHPSCPAYPGIWEIDWNDETPLCVQNLEGLNVSRTRKIASPKPNPSPLFMESASNG